MPALQLATDDGGPLALTTQAPANGTGNRLRCADGSSPRAVRLVAATDDNDYARIAAACDDDPEAIAQALIDGDPDCPLQEVGRHFGRGKTVQLRADGSVVEAPRIMRVRYDQRGEEIAREPFVDRLPTVVDVLACTAEPVAIASVVHRWVFSRSMQVRHQRQADGQRCLDLARRLHDGACLLPIGEDLVFTRNGTPYRCFLEGRVQGDAYALILHCSELPLQALPTTEDVP